MSSNSGTSNGRPRQHASLSAAAAAASSTAVKRQSFEVNEQFIRSRPSSPSPSLRNDNRDAPFDDEDVGIYLNGAANVKDRSSAGAGAVTGLGVGLSVPRHPLSTTPLSATSSGQSTPLDKRKPAYPDVYLDSPPPSSSFSTRGGNSNSNKMRIDTSMPEIGNERSPLLSIGVERPSTPNIQQREYLSIPHDYDSDLDVPSFVSSERGGSYKRPPTLRSRIKLFWTQLFANLVSTGFLLLIVAWALAARGLGYLLSRLAGKTRQTPYRAWDNPHRWQKEELVKDVKYYARSCGYDIEDQEIVTQDGYKLRVHRVIVPSQRGNCHADGRGGFPVIIQHGLFQTSGSFVTSEERSLAFWLAEKGGYQVYLSNARAVFDMGHETLSRSDPRFWDYNIRELALYDLPAVVEHVKRETGYEKVAFIGHSQGNATMFCSLARGMVPSLGDSLSVFVALAPAVYAGPLTRGFPFTAIKNMPWKTWRRIFGVLDYIPVMRWSYDWVPGLPFALLGYQMFAFLFDWTDKNWLPRRKPKMFRFTPSPVSSASVWWWTGAGGNFAQNGCILNEQVDRWYGPSFPPLALYHGGRDFLVLAEPLLRRLAEHEADVRVIRVHKLEEGEHCDNFWEADAVENSFVHILEDIEKTRPRYPEELDRETRQEAPDILI